MNKKQRANAYKRLLEDDTFKMVLEEVTGEQVDVFLDPNSNGEGRDDAHYTVVALKRVVDYMEGVIASDIIDDRKKTQIGEQHRYGND